LLPPFENTEGIILLLLLLELPLRETRRLDPGMSLNEDFFLVALVEPIPEELEALAPVPVDKSSAICIDELTLLDGEVDKVGDCCTLFPRRNELKAPSHRFRGGVPHGDGVSIITESELAPVFTDEQEVGPSIN